MPSRLRPLLLCAIVLLAGCGGLGDSSTESTDTPQESLPAGLADDEVTNASTLAAAHDASLANVSFTTRFAETMVAENGTHLLNRTGQIRATANHSVWGGTTTYGVPQRIINTSATEVNAWSNGTATFYRALGAGETQYATYLWAGNNWTGQQMLRLFYRNVTDVTATMDNGSVHLSAQLSGTLKAGQYPGVNITNGTLTARLTDSGRVKQYSVNHTGTLIASPGTTVEGHYGQEFSSLNETTIESPAWVPTAQNESTPSSVQTPTGS